MELTTEAEERKAFYAKLSRVQRDTNRVGADTTRHAPSISPQKAIEDIGGALTKEGLVLVWDLEDVGAKRVVQERTDSKSGEHYTEVWFYTTVRVAYHLTDVETGFTLTTRSAGTSYNKDGDGTVHAISQATKQYLLRLAMARVVRPNELDNGPRPEPPERARENAAPNPPPAKPTENGGSPSQERRESQRIPEAQGVRFRRRQGGVGGWMRKDTGALLPTCPAEHDVPMIRIPPDGNRWLCIHAECGECLSHEDVEAARQDEKIPELRDTYDRLIREGRIYDWQEAAVIEADQRLSIGKDKWSFKDWEGVVQAFQNQAPKLIKKSLADMAEDTPAAEERIQYLRHIMQESDLAFAERTECEEAIQSKWHDAVETVIERYGGRKDQTEAPFGEEAKAT